jgi:hypothetical protein
MRPCPAVDGGAGRHIADAEFGGQLPEGHAVGPARPQLSHFLLGQLGPGVTLADCAVIVAMAFPAPWLESDPEVVDGGIDRRPVLSWLTAINAGVSAGRAAGLLDALVPCGIGRVGGLPGGTGQLVSADPGAALTVAADHGERPADRAVFPLVFRLAARASA